jgi:hypothetical protein
MNASAWLFLAWGLVTAPLLCLLVYRSRLEKHESDWIPLTEMSAKTAPFTSKPQSK